ncbi:MAG: replication protein RepA [Rhodopila sp.]|jgi:hypothetical protein
MASPIQQRLLDFATDIVSTTAEDLAFQHSILTQCSLPIARPSDGTLVWERQQGRARLMIEAGKVLDPRTGHFTQLSLPYGPKARLLLMHLNSEAVRRQTPIIPVEDSMTAFFRRLMGRTQDGRQARMLKLQLSSLAAATFRMGITQGDERALQVDTKVVGAFDLWLQRDDNQRILWPSTLRLSLDYYESLMRFAVPLDERAISALAHSALALDIYCWLAQRLHRIPAGKPQFVPWIALFDQFGQGYKEIRFFRRDFLRLLDLVKGVYPGARLGSDRRGMCLEASPPPVTKRLAVVTHVIPGQLQEANRES